MSISSLFRSIRKNSSRSRSRRHAVEKLRRRMRPEALEQRSLMTTTVFLDYGFDFPANGLFVTDERIDDVADGPDGFPDSGTSLISLRQSVLNQGIDIDGNGTVDQTDARRLADQITASVRRTFEPFDIVVREVSADNFADIARSLSGASGNDAYIIVAGSNAGVEDTPFGRADVDFDGLTPGNDEDNIGVAFADTMLSNNIRALGIARTAAHEAGHTFGLLHSYGGAGDLMSITNVDPTVQHFVGRRSLELDEAVPVVYEEQNAYEHLADPDVVGLRSGGRGYVTGTDQSEAISITRTGAGRAQVNISVGGFLRQSYAIDSSQGITIEAGPGNDIITIQSDIGVPIDVRGGSGTDTLQLFDRDLNTGITYEVRDGRVTNNVGLDLEYLSSELETLRLRAGARPDVFNVHSLAAGTTLHVIADDGSDPPQGANRIRLAPLGRDLSAIQGNIDYGSRSTIDRVELNDQSEREDVDYDIDASASFVAEIRRQDAGRYRFDGVNEVTLRGGGGDSDFDVEDTRAGVRWYVYAGGGADRLRLSPVRRDIARLGHSTTPQFLFDGQSGADRVELYDSNATYPGTYTFVDPNLGTPVPAIHRSAEDGRGWIVGYEDVGRVTYFGGSRDDTLNVDYVPEGTALDLRGGGGADAFHVGGGNVMSNVLGSVVVAGNGGEDTLTINDQDDRAGSDVATVNGGAGIVTGTYLDEYHLDRDSFWKRETQWHLLTTGGQPHNRVYNSPVITYDSVDRVTVEGSGARQAELQGGSSIFRVHETHRDTDYTLRGNDGNDTFLIDGGDLESDVVVSGGADDDSPGDRLVVDGAGDDGGRYSPQGEIASSGYVRVDGNDVRYNGIESLGVENFDRLTLVTPRSRDRIFVGPGQDGWGFVSGESGVVPRQFMTMRFRDVRELTIDAAATDFVPEQFNNQFLAPIPHDEISVMPGAMNADGLETLRLLTGGGSNVVHDRTLESPTSSAGLLHVDGAGGATTVIVYGAAFRADFEHLDGAEAELRLYDDEDESLHRIRTFAVPQLVMPDAAERTNAIIRDGAISLRRSGDNQVITGGFTSFLTRPTTGSERLDVIPQGDSRLVLGELVFENFGISPTRPRDAGPQPEPPRDPVQLGISPTDAGPQPEPPSNPIELSGFGPDDRITWFGGLIDDVPIDTDFGLDTCAAGLCLAVTVSPDSSPSEWNFEIETAGDGSSPQLAIQGDPDARNHFEMRLSDVGSADHVRPLLTRVSVENVERLGVPGTALNDLAEVELRSSGNLSWRLTPEERDPEADIDVTIEARHAVAAEFHFEGGSGQDRVELTMTGRSPRAYGFNFQGTESIAFGFAENLAPGKQDIIVHSISPEGSTIDAGSIVLMSDSSTTSTHLTGSTLTTNVSGLSREGIRVPFAERMEIVHDLTGSHSTVEVSDSIFDAGLSVRQNGASDSPQNVATQSYRNVEINRKSQWTATGGSGDDLVTITQDDVTWNALGEIMVEAGEGDDVVRVMRRGVTTRDANLLAVDTGGGDDVIVSTTDAGLLDGPSSSTLDAGGGNDVIVSATSDVSLNSSRGVVMTGEDGNVFLFGDHESLSIGDSLESARVEPSLSPIVDRLRDLVAEFHAEKKSPVDSLPIGDGEVSNRLDVATPHGSDDFVVIRADHELAPNVNLEVHLNVDGGEDSIHWDTDSTLIVRDIELNAAQVDPANLATGSQPTSWSRQRSDLRSIRITFNQPVVARAEHFRLVNLGLDGSGSSATEVRLTEGHVATAGSVVTLHFGPGELADGVYRLEVLATLTSAGGGSLDGNGDGHAGDAFVHVGSRENGFYKLTGDFNGDGGVSIFDFATFSYWFGTSAATAPEYVDLNRDGGVSIFDFSGYSAGFGRGVTFPPPPAPSELPFPGLPAGVELIDAVWSEVAEGEEADDDAEGELFLGGQVDVDFVRERIDKS